MSSICLVHGLAGDAKSTWTAHIPETGEQLFWPTKLLASQHSTNSTFPKARIMLYGYETSVNSLSWLTERTLYYHANHLLDQLIQKRKDNRDRPLFFIAHSLGGLLVKNALIFARAVGNPSDTEAREIYLSTFGIVSFGTPQTFVGNAPLEDMIERLCQYLRDYVGSDDSIRRLTFEDFDSGKDWVKYVDRLQRRLNQYKPLAKEIPEMFCYESSENIYLNRVRSLLLPLNAIAPLMSPATNLHQENDDSAKTRVCPSILQETINQAKPPRNAQVLQV